MEERRKVGDLRRFTAFANGTCEVCLQKEITMMTGCRRNRFRFLGVCDSCGADFHNVNSILASSCCQFAGAC
ncbi:MAG: hypothetical protein ACWGHO_02930 [Candidatus Moraniibacteriota bacterium]